MIIIITIIIIIIITSWLLSWTFFRLFSHAHFFSLFTVLSVIFIARQHTAADARY